MLSFPLRWVVGVFGELFPFCWELVFPEETIPSKKQANLSIRFCKTAVIISCTSINSSLTVQPEDSSLLPDVWVKSSNIFRYLQFCIFYCGSVGTRKSPWEKRHWCKSRLKMWNLDKHLQITITDLQNIWSL